MKKTITLFVSLFSIFVLYPQKSPAIKVGNHELGITTLDIKVEVIGNIAITTFDMLFYNPTNSILEGELSFPLGEGFNVSRFALDVNGKLREAVVVEKEIGRIAFESVVRRGVDPALLEKGTGNNYKARIYPIPANGYKRVLLAYEQDLILNIGGHYYNLPLNFINKLDEFKLEITVFDQKSMPVVTNGQISGLDFSNWHKNYSTKVKKNNYTPNENLIIKIPLPISTQKVITSENYFYIYKTFNPEKRLREQPKEITIYWDASLSMKNKDLEKELSILNKYFLYLNDLNVRFISFSNSIISDKKFRIRDGKWNDLQKEIKNVIYDGGTSFKSIIEIKNDADINILFTDGIYTLSDMLLETKKPVFIINSLIKSNHKALNQLAEISDGAYINLKTESLSDALRKVKYKSYKFLGYESSNSNLEVYPKLPLSVSNDFSLSGKDFKNGETIILNFGHGNKITQRLPIVIKNNEISNGQIKRVWAQKKLDFLEIDTKINESEIIKLAKKYSLVSEYTSLIVLEDVRDYIAFEILPPEELMSEYNRLMAQREVNSKQKNSLSNAIEENQSDVPITERIQENIPPPPATERIEIVSDLQNLEEVVLESTETDESEVVEVEEYVVEEENVEDVPFAIIEEVPIYPGCEGDKRNRKDCFSNKVKGFLEGQLNIHLVNSLNLSPGSKKIYTTFTLNKHGNIENIKVRAPHIEIANEVVRVINLLPQMTPGKQRGRPVNVKYTLPITFFIEYEQTPENYVTEAWITVTDNTVSSERDVRRIKTYPKYSGSLEVKERKVISVYLSELEKAGSKEEFYKIYLKQRENYLDIPAYFTDVSNFFKYKFKGENYSSRILSNIAEIDFDNYELLKAYAYQLQVNQQNDLAVFIFEQILNLRPEDSQSYRDLALAYQNIGKCQEALNLFNGIITGEIYKNTKRRIFKGIEDIAKNEIRNLIQLYKEDLDISKVDKELTEPVSYDVRIIIDWNHNDTDIDLHIIDPNLEECYYNHNRTRIGGKISKDMTQGFGPEEYILKKAIKGSYFVKIKYFGDRYQKIENPTFLKVTIFKNYGSQNETKEIMVIRLTNNDKEEIIAELIF